MLIRKLSVAPWVAALLLQLFLSSVLFAETGPAPVTSANKVSPAFLADIEKRLLRIEKLLDSGTLLDLLQQVETLRQEVAEIRGVIEVNEHQLDKIRSRQRDLYADTDRRLQSLENPGFEERSDARPDAQSDVVDNMVAPLTSGERQIPIDKTTGSVSIDEGIEREYQRAFAFMKQSRYGEAIKALNSFLKKYPDSIYSDKAQYWIAEALYVERRYESAIQEYKKLLVSYPDSQRVPQSLLKIGYSYQESGQIDMARQWYIDVKKRFPGTASSRLAEERLKSISNS